MDHIIGQKPEAVVATGGNHLNDLADMAFITVYFPGNVTAHINVNWLSPVKVRTTLIGGRDKMLVWNDLEPDEKIKVYDKGVNITNGEGVYDLLVSYRSGDVWSPKVEATEALTLELGYFLDCIVEGKTPVERRRGRPARRPPARSRGAVAERSRAIVLCKPTFFCNPRRASRHKLSRSMPSTQSATLRSWTTIRCPTERAAIGTLAGAVLRKPASSSSAKRSRSGGSWAAARPRMPPIALADVSRRRDGRRWPAVPAVRPRRSGDEPEAGAVSPEWLWPPAEDDVRRPAPSSIYYLLRPFMGVRRAKAPAEDSPAQLGEDSIPSMAGGSDG